MIIRKNGASKMYSFLKEPSTAFALGDAVTFNASGRIIPAVAGSTQIAGFIKRAVVASDADYASASLVACEIFNEDNVFEIDASATVTQAMVGTARDLTNAGVLNVGAGATVSQFRVLGIGSTATKAIVTCIKNSFTV